MTIAIYSDGADLQTMARLAPECDGCTTNPSLMRKAGVKDYRAFALDVLSIWGKKPVSFEVLADDIETMRRQAIEMAGWSDNVYVKIPITTSRGESCCPLISDLTKNGVKVNVTALFSFRQVDAAGKSVRTDGNILSIFAGRIADCGVDPCAIVSAASLAYRGAQRILWASARQAYSKIEAERSGADIITLTPDLIEKTKGFGRSLDEYSRQTVEGFARDAEGIAF